MVASFKYLGSLVTEQNSVLAEIEERVATGNRGLQHIFRSKFVSTASKIRIYKTLLRSLTMVTYSAKVEEEERIFLVEEGRKETQRNKGPWTVSRRISGDFVSLDGLDGDDEWRRIEGNGGV